MKAQRRLVALVVSLLVITAAVVVLGDTVGRRYLEREIATRISREVNLDTAPTVSIKDKVLLGSLITQHFDDVRVSAPSVTLPSGITVGVSAVLTDVTAASGMTKFVAGGVFAQATVAYSEVSTVVGHPVTWGGDGRLAVDMETGRSAVPMVQVSVKPGVDSQSHLVLSEPKVTVANYTLPDAITRPLIAALVKPIDLGMPSSLSATAVDATEDGLIVTITGSDVDLTALK